MLLLCKFQLCAKTFFDWIDNNSPNGCVKPHNIFNSNEAEKGFRYMTTGKHSEKIIIKIRDEENYRRPVMEIKPAQERTVTKKTYFHLKKVYLIIGGIGGMGSELNHLTLDDIGFESMIATDLLTN